METTWDFIENRNDRRQYAKIYEMLKDNTIHELDIPKIMPYNDADRYSIYVVKCILSNLVFPEHLKILKLPEFFNRNTNCINTNRVNTIVLKLNDGLEELYINQIYVLEWLPYIPLSLKNIVVDTPFTPEQSSRHIHKLPYNCSIQNGRYITAHRYPGLQLRKK